MRHLAVGLATAASLLALAAPAHATLVLLSNTANAALTVDAFADGKATNTLSAPISAGSTVLAAYLYSADVFGNNPTTAQLTFEGNTFNWASGTLLAPDANPANTRRIDVTSIVKPLIEQATPQTSFSISENGVLDGEVLVVVYRNASTTGNAIILDGELALAGDTTTLGFTSPYAGGAVTLSLASSFSYNGNSNTDLTGQVTLIDVSTNTNPGLRRLTSCAGGNDDAAFLAANGSLLTAGGVGDSSANPDPNCAGGAGDDELYDLSQGNSASATPFINNGDTTITFTTSNPSNDDNVFGLFLTTPQQTIVNPAPEPASVALLGLGLGALALRRRRAA